MSVISLSKKVALFLAAVCWTIADVFEWLGDLLEPEQYE